MTKVILMSVAYRLAKACSSGNQSMFQGLPQSICWKPFWKMKLPLKILHFILRLYNKVVAVGSKLMRVLLGIIPTYPLCWSQEETTLHLLVYCEVAILVWFRSNLGIQITNLQVRDIGAITKV